MMLDVKKLLAKVLSAIKQTASDLATTNTMLTTRTNVRVYNNSNMDYYNTSWYVVGFQVVKVGRQAFFTFKGTLSNYAVADYVLATLPSAIRPIMETPLNVWVSDGTYLLKQMPSGWVGTDGRVHVKAMEPNNGSYWFVNGTWTTNGYS